jgi:hypothetical protein
MTRRASIFLLALTSCSGQLGEAAAEDAGTATPTDDSATTTETASADSAPADSAIEDTAPPPATTVPMFLAIGKLGRSTVSCDDGRTWIADRSEVPDGVCWNDASPKNIECDHHAWSSVGLLRAKEHVLATFGWGYAGVVRRTADGITWEDVLPGHTFAGLAYGNDRVVANDRSPWASSADGAKGSWEVVGSIESSVWNVRRIGFVPGGAGRFIVTLESGEGRDIVLSDDNGKTFRSAKTRPAACAHWVSDILTSKGVTVIVQNDGSVCRSTDRGETWTHKSVTGSFSSNGLVVEDAFVVWDGSTRYRSTDGESWTSEAGTAGVIVGPVARSSTGTYAAIKGGWSNWYDKQQFYRSADGLKWETLPTTAFKQGHPITHVTFVDVKPSAQCPLK